MNGEINLNNKKMIMTNNWRYQIKIVSNKMINKVPIMMNLVKLIQKYKMLTFYKMLKIYNNYNYYKIYNIIIWLIILLKNKIQN